MQDSTRLRIDYFDQNETLRSLFPLVGAVVGHPRPAGIARAWTLLRLDQELLYEGAAHGHLLLAPRDGATLAEEGEHVHVLLIEAGRALPRDGFSY